MNCVAYFVLNISNEIVVQVKKDAIAISLIKGMRVRPEGPQLISAMVQRLLRIDCSVLMGANIATDIGELTQMNQLFIQTSNFVSTKNTCM